MFQASTSKAELISSDNTDVAVDHDSDVDDPADVGANDSLSQPTDTTIMLDNTATIIAMTNDVQPGTSLSPNLKINRNSSVNTFMEVDSQSNDADLECPSASTSHAVGQIFPSPFPASAKSDNLCNMPTIELRNNKARLEAIESPGILPFVAPDIPQVENIPERIMVSDTQPPIESESFSTSGPSQVAGRIFDTNTGEVVCDSDSQGTLISGLHEISPCKSRRRREKVPISYEADGTSDLPHVLSINVDFPEFISEDPDVRYKKYVTW